jgi:long-chain-acyl-CoA dehydrogenase
MEFRLLGPAGSGSMRAGYYDADLDVFRTSFRAFCEREGVPRHHEWDAWMFDREIWRITGQRAVAPRADRAR